MLFPLADDANAISFYKQLRCAKAVSRAHCTVPRSIPAAGSIVPGSIPAAVLTSTEVLSTAGYADEDFVSISKEIPDHFLELSEPVPGGDTHHIYIREKYDKLYDCCFSTQFSLILGTPGVGKSMAVFYFVWKLLHDDKHKNATIVLRNVTAYYVVYTKKENNVVSCVVYNNSVSTSLVEFDSPETIFIFDGIAPEFITSDPKGKILLSSSPRRTLWGKYQYSHLKPSCFYLSILTLEELKIMRKYAFSHISVELFRQYYLKWGGSARLNFCWSMPEHQKKLDSNLSGQLTHDNLFKAIYNAIFTTGGTEGNSYPEESCHLVFHVVADDNLKSFQLIFASDYIESLAIEMLEESKWDESDQMSRALLVSNGQSSIAGCLFEIRCKSLLFHHPDVGKIINLYTWDNDEFTLTTAHTLNCPKKEKLRFIKSNLKSVVKDRCEDTLQKYVLIPLYFNFDSIDLITVEMEHTKVVVYMWQTTISSPEKHGIILSGLEIVRNAFPKEIFPNVEFRFIWVLSAEEGRVTQLRRPDIVSSSVPCWARDMPQFVTFINDKSFPKIENDLPRQGARTVYTRKRTRRA